jgi:hypothetical protein
MLGSSGHVKLREADLVTFAGAMRPEELLTSIEPAEGILTTIEGWEGELVIARNAHAFTWIIWKLHVMGWLGLQWLLMRVELLGVAQNWRHWRQKLNLGDGHPLG